jgi:catechol 2,3-dioxygenase-like lactoylglutathione lyase family enzyme
MNMTLKIEAINHVCLVVKDTEAAERFYTGIFGFKRHHKRTSWLVLNNATTLHLVHIPEAEIDQSLYHEVQHFALQVSDLRNVLKLALHHDLKPFQMDFEGKEKPVSAVDDPLTFGLGSLFVRDPDGNLIEFLQIGHGVFTPDMQPSAS